MDEKEYSTVEATGEIRVKALESGNVGLSIFGTYAVLTPRQAEDLGEVLDKVAYDARYGASDGEWP